MLNLCKRNGKSKWKVMVGAVLSLMITLTLTACSGPEKPATTSGSTPPQSKQENTANTGSIPPQSEQQSTPGTMETAEMEGQDLVIPISDITEKAAFYPVVVDGTKMEVIAVEAPDGTIRTAYNTCQICYDSGRGYYKQVGDKLVCQNCGNQFAMSQVEVESGGCNPWPIFSKSKIVTDESITISYDFLKESKELFGNWKSSY